MQVLNNIFIDWLIKVHFLSLELHKLDTSFEVKINDYT